MLAMALVTVMVVGMTVLFPETDAARALNRWLVEAPARWLNRTAMWRIGFYAGMIAAGVMMTVLFGAEGMILYGAMAPEVLAWAVMFDVGVVIDALLITAAVLATNGLKVARMQGRAVVDRVLVRVRTRWTTRARRVRQPTSRGPRKSDDDRPAWAAQPVYRPFSMA